MPTALIRKPETRPSTPFPPQPIRFREGNWLWIPLRGEWRDVAAKPEEIVRQTFIRHLIDHYGYSLAQMDQERRTQHGRKSPRADIVIWETPEKKANNDTQVLVVECKAEGVDIDVKDYYQGESYTRAVGCEFFIAHNTRFTAMLIVPGLPGDFVQINEIAKASDWGDAKRIEEIKNKLRAFNRKEFQDLLFKCHSILRDVHKMEPGRRSTPSRKSCSSRCTSSGRDCTARSPWIFWTGAPPRVCRPIRLCMTGSLSKRKTTTRPTTFSPPTTGSKSRRKRSAAS